jgi:hypothetical protein
LVSNANIKGDTGVAVGRRTLFFRFGSGDVVEKIEPNLYSAPYAIIVTDATGNPIPNQQLNVAITSTKYRKGRHLKRPLIGAFVNWESIDSITCQSEDVDRDGVLDFGEDFNVDKQLTPGNVATVARTVTADADGIAQVNLVYPREYATWVIVEMTVSGIASGTENVSSRELLLQILGSDTTTESNAPPPSPFGIGRAVDDDKIYVGGPASCATTD